jgi:hypothetical protein
MIVIVFQPVFQKLQELLPEAESRWLLGGVVMMVMVMVMGVMMVMVMHAGSPWGMSGSKTVAGWPAAAARGNCRFAP